MLNFEEVEIFGRKAYRRELIFRKGNFLGEIYSYRIIDYLIPDYISPENVLKEASPIKGVAEQRFLIKGNSCDFRKKFFFFGLKGSVKVFVFGGRSCKIPPDFADLVKAYREVVKS